MEGVLAGELVALGLAARAIPGGAEAEGDDAAALACLASRTADSVLLRLWEGPSRELRAGRRDARHAVGAGAELTSRVEGGRAIVSADAAGAPLFRRGWRARVGAAPLRETLAAAVLLSFGWDGDRAFLDPMCGSGTIAIEAALIAAGRAPGLGRSFAFERFAGHDAARTERLRARLAAEVRPVSVRIQASDRNAGVLRLAARNAEAAGVANIVRFSREDASRVSPPAVPGLCVTNPPWGVRLDEAATDAWRALGALLARLPGWEVGVLGPDRGYERLLPMAPVWARPLRAGKIACRLLRYAP